MCSTDQERRNTAPRGPNRTIHRSHGNRFGPRAADTIFRAVRDVHTCMHMHSRSRIPPNLTRRVAMRACVRELCTHHSYGVPADTLALAGEPCIPKVGSILDGKRAGRARSGQN